VTWGAGMARGSRIEKGFLSHFAVCEAKEWRDNLGIYVR
jgi:hypothetical protein